MSLCGFTIVSATVAVAEPFSRPQRVRWPFLQLPDFCTEATTERAGHTAVGACGQGAGVQDGKLNKAADGFAKADGRPVSWFWAMYRIASYGI